MFRPYFQAQRTSIPEILQYKNHLERISNMAKKDENEAPMLPADTYVRLEKCEVDAQRLGEIERENRDLVRRMNIVGRTKGKIDTELKTQALNSNHRNRKLKNMDIENNNVAIYQAITSLKSKYNKQECLRDYQLLEKAIVEGSRYPDFYERKEKQKWSLIPANMDRSQLEPKQRVRCYFIIAEKGGATLGKLEFEIWLDVAPIAGCNFINLCKGYEGYCYKNTPIHTIFGELFCVGGDIVNQTGTGVYSIYGGLNSTFGDENNTLEFNGPGVLATHTVFAGENHSQFLITFRKLTTMNKQFVVFGRVVGSTRVLEMMESYGNICGRPSPPIIIQNSGVKVRSYMIIDPEYFMEELPPKLSLQDSRKTLPNILSSYDRICNRPTDDELETTVRRSIIKDSRAQLKDMGYPAHKMDMALTKKSLTALKSSKNTRKKNGK